MLSVFQEALGSRAYEGGNTVANDAIGIAFLGLIAALAKPFVAAKAACKSSRNPGVKFKISGTGGISGCCRNLLDKNQKKTGEYS